MINTQVASDVRFDTFILQAQDLDKYTLRIDFKLEFEHMKHWKDHINTFYENDRIYAEIRKKSVLCIYISLNFDQMQYFVQHVLLKSNLNIGDAMNYFISNTGLNLLEKLHKDSLK